MVPCKRGVQSHAGLCLSLHPSRPGLMRSSSWLHSFNCGSNDNNRRLALLEVGEPLSIPGLILRPIEVSRGLLSLAAAGDGFHDVERSDRSSPDPRRATTTTNKVNLICQTSHPRDNKQASRLPRIHVWATLMEASRFPTTVRW